MYTIYPSIHLYLYLYLYLYLSTSNAHATTPWNRRRPRRARHSAAFARQTRGSPPGAPPPLATPSQDRGPPKDRDPRQDRDPRKVRVPRQDRDPRKRARAPLGRAQHHLWRGVSTPSLQSTGWAAPDRRLRRRWRRCGTQRPRTGRRGQPLCRRSRVCSCGHCLRRRRRLSPLPPCRRQVRHRLPGLRRRRRRRRRRA